MNVIVVRYVLGRAGKGKSQFIYRDIEKYLDGAERLILLVPEQYVLSVEQELIKSLNLAGIIQVEVMSISTLAWRILNEEGGRTRVLLNKLAKNMVLRKVLDERVEELGIFKKTAARQGFINKISTFISLLKQEKVFPEDMLEQTRAEEKIMAAKLKDIALIYKYYNEYLKKHGYLDNEDRINLFIARLGESAFVKGARVWVDGFSDFSQQTLDCIEKVMQLAHKTTITFTLDNNIMSRDQELFLLSRYNCQKIHELAVKHSLREEFRLIKSPGEFNSSAEDLKHLEKELFAYPEEQYGGEIKSIHIQAALNPSGEVEDVAGTIIALVRDNSYRWRDIGIVCQALDSYRAIFTRVFKEYSIPCFMEQKNNITDNSIMQFVLAALDSVWRGYQYEDIFRLLKTGFSNLQVNEYELLENYVLELGIDGDKWANDFVVGSEETLIKLNNLRLLLMNPLFDFAGDVEKNSTFSGISQALFNYLAKVKLREKVMAWTTELRQQGHFQLAGEVTQIWNAVIECLEQIVEIFKDQVTTLAKYREVLKAGLASATLESIPVTVDQVWIGSLSSLRSSNLKALFIVGVNDGSLPAVAEKEDLLSGEELEILRSRNIKLGIDKVTKASAENFLIYSVLSKARERLYFSYALADEEGRALRPSLFIERLKRVFPTLQIKSNIVVDEKQAGDIIATPHSSFKYLVEKMRLYADGNRWEDYWGHVYNWYYQDSSWRGTLLNVVEGLSHENQLESIGSQRARELYGQPLRASVSRLEKFIQCPFAHFVQYGLKPAERKEFAFNAPERGEFYHSSLERFAVKLRQKNMAWHHLETEKIGTIVEEVTEKIQADFAHGILGSNPRYKYWYRRLTKVLTRSVEVVTEQIKSGDFEPRNFEVRFGEGGQFPPIMVALANGKQLFLEGRIDRVDWLDTEDSTYVRIVDYKSGFKKFSLSDIYNGLSLQLLIYLMAVTDYLTDEDGRKIKPAAMLYFHIDDPMVEVKNETPEQIFKAIRKKFKMQGLVLENVSLVRQMDKNLETYSDIIPVGITKKEEFYKNSSVIGEREFHLLMDFGRKLVRAIGEKILQGYIKMEPYVQGNYTACTYCRFKTICQFDKLLVDNNYRNIRNYKNEEVIQLIEQELGGPAHD